jgi:hypothetical protein
MKLRFISQSLFKNPQYKFKQDREQSANLFS